MLSGYTIEISLMIKDKSEDLEYPKLDTWKMETSLKEIKDRCMDKLLVPQNMKQIDIKKQKKDVIIKSNKISIILLEERIVLLDS